MARDQLRQVKDAVIDTLRDQNGGTPLTELRERVCSIHLYNSDRVRTAIMQLIEVGTLKINETDRLIYRG